MARSSKSLPKGIAYAWDSVNKVYVPISGAPDGDLVTHEHTAAVTLPDGVSNSTTRIPVNETDYGYYATPVFPWVFNGTTWDRLRGDTQGLQTHSPNYIVKYDDAGSGITYVGYAAPGSSVASAVWRIFRLDESASPDFDKLYADGNANFDNVWDNRLILSYS